MTSVKPKLGYLGVGLMGGPMAARLVSSGYPVSAFDIDRSRLAAAERLGIRIANSPLDAAADASIVLLNLPNQDAIEEVVFGREGFAQSLAPPQLVVDFSTVSPIFARAVAARILADTGCDWVDAPVSGGPQASADGTLTIMAGGSPRAIARIDSLVSDVGRQFTHAGEAGMGSAAKAVAQLIVATNYAVLAEAARFAEKIGMNAALLPECVKHGHADGVLMQQLYPRIAAHDFAPRAYARQLLKDLEMIQDMAREAGSPTPMSAQATQLFRQLIAAGFGEIDGTGVYRIYEGAAADQVPNGESARG